MAYCWKIYTVVMALALLFVEVAQPQDTYPAYNPSSESYGNAPMKPANKEGIASTTFPDGSLQDIPQDLPPKSYQGQLNPLQTLGSPYEQQPLQQQPPQIVQPSYPKVYTPQTGSSTGPTLMNDQTIYEPGYLPVITSNATATNTNTTANDTLSAPTSFSANVTGIKNLNATGSLEGTQLNDTTAPSTNSDGQEPAKTGMDQKDRKADSLVDYMLGLGEDKDKEKTPRPSDIPTPTASTTVPNKTNIIPGAYPQAAYPFDIAQPGAATESSQSSATPATAVTTPGKADVSQIPGGYGDASDCSIPASLESCGMPVDARAYFNYNVSVQGVLSSIFEPSKVKDLRSQCEPGAWCLSNDVHLSIMEGMKRFYLDGPLCSGAMWACLESIKSRREACDDKDLTFLMGSTQTLCDLSEFGLADKACYTRTTEALYTTYVHTFPNPDQKPVEPTTDEFCESYTAKMTKTYLCADDACSYDQIVILERFQPWVELAKNATAVSSYCNMTALCQYEEAQDAIDEIEEEIKEATGGNIYAEDYYDDEEEGEYFDDDEDEEDDEEDNKTTSQVVSLNGFGGLPSGDTAGSFANSAVVSGTGQDVYNSESNLESEVHDNNLFLGMIIMAVTAALVVLALSVFVYRRFNSGRGSSYNWVGYTHLSEEERMLKNEFN